MYATSASVVFFGLKIVGLSEKVAILLLIAFSAVIVLGSLGAWHLADGPFAATSPGWKESLAVFGVVIYSHKSAIAVPQAVKRIRRHPGI